MSITSEHTEEIASDKLSAETVPLEGKVSVETNAFPLGDKTSVETVVFSLKDKVSVETVAFTIKDNELPQRDILGGNIVAIMTGGVLYKR